MPIYVGTSNSRVYQVVTTSVRVVSVIGTGAVSVKGRKAARGYVTISGIGAVAAIGTKKETSIGKRGSVSVSGRGEVSARGAKNSRGSVVVTGIGQVLASAAKTPSVVVVGGESRFSIDMFTCDNTGDWKRALTEATLDSVSWRLNQYGLATISVDPLSPDAVALSALNEIEVQIWFNEELAWWGIPRRVSGSLDKLSFECEELLSEFLYVFLVDKDLDYNNLEQKNIVANLVTYAQSMPGQNRNIVVGAFSPSGITRKRTYLKEDYPNILELISAFPGLQNGLDYEVRVFGDGRREFLMHYPEKGIYKPAHPLELDQFGRKNVTGLSFSRDAMGQVNDIYVTGANNEATGTKYVGRYTQNPLGPAGRRQLVLSVGEIDSVNWLNDKARAEGLARQTPVAIPDIKVSDDLYKKVVTGDRVPVRIDYGAIQMNGTYRVTEISWSPEGLTLGVQPA